MIFVRLLCSIVCLMGIFVAGLEAGVLIVSSHESSPEPNRVSTHKAYVDKDRMRVELGGKEADRVFIFRQDQDRFWLIDNKDKTYTEMTKEDLHKMKGNLDAGIAMMQKKMQDMPPEQRKMMEQMMSKLPGAKPEAFKIVYKKVASREKVNQWLCDKYEGHGPGQDKTELWTTNWQQTGITEADLKVFRGMGDFFAEFVKHMPFLAHIGSKEWAQERGYAGFPIRTMHYSGTQVRSKTEVKAIRRQDFAPSLFDLPSGLEQNATP